MNPAPPTVAPVQRCAGNNGAGAVQPDVAGRPLLRYGRSMSLFGSLPFLAGLAAVLLVLTVAAGVLDRRRSLTAWGLVPWDYVMLLSGILLMVTLAWVAELWRNGATF